jgi:hypothetical protein
MNTNINNKMDTWIYIGSSRQSIIPYIQCKWVSALLISVRSIKECVMGGGGYMLRSVCEKKLFFRSRENSWE